MSIIIIGTRLDRERDRLPESIGIQYGWGVTEKWGIERSTVLTIDDFIVNGVDALDLARRLRRTYGQESVLLIERTGTGNGSHRITLSPDPGADCTLLDGGCRFAVEPDGTYGDVDAYFVTEEGCDLLP